MNSASQPDTPSEWSKFAPLPLRLRSHSESPNTENLAAADPSSETSLSPAPIAATPVEIQINTLAADEPTPLVAFSAPAHPAEQFVCQHRRCRERRERRGQPPRHLLTAHWRSMKIGKRQTLVVDLTILCPDCGFEHRATLFPPEWLDSQE